MLSPELTIGHASRLHAPDQYSKAIPVLRKTLVLTSLLLILLAVNAAEAQDQIPETSGFSGYGLLGPGYFNVESNLIVTGAPLLSDVGEPQIESIFDGPSAQSSAAFLLALEINYTFASTRTQLFLGNRIEDLLRLDIAYGLGVRQELPDGSILAASFLLTPLHLKFWADPYVEGEDRKATELNFPGFRLRWGSILGSGLELTLTDRFYSFDEEKSGSWLVDEGRLDPREQPVLNRDGDVLRFQMLYRFYLKNQHRFEPALRLVNDRHEGAAIANKGFSFRLTYLYISPKVILDANGVWGQNRSDAIHPVYGEVLDASRWGAALTAFVPVNLFQKNGWSVFAGVEIFEENVNVDFFDSRIASINVGLIWRHRRP
jgi:hypothetical protein